jgi:hypothetical protein
MNLLRPLKSRRESPPLCWCWDKCVLALPLAYYSTNISAFTGFTSVYQGSFKQPDFFFRANSNEFPTIAIESGWLESFPHLRADKDLWMQGNASVELMILLR